MASKGFLDEHPNPTMEDVKHGLGGNLCRCGTYMGVRQAVLRSRQEYEGSEKWLTHPTIAGRRWIRRKIMGKPMKRLDGPQKAAGRAKYTSDLKMKDLLYAVYLTCPHAHARITSIDTAAAEKMNGVKAVHVHRRGRQGTAVARPGSGRRSRHHRGSSPRSRSQDQGRLRSDAALGQ